MSNVKRNYSFKPVEELTFTDDFMFGEVMKNEKICVGVLERLLNIKIDHITYPELQKSLKPFYTSRGVRLDVYVKDYNSVFDVELQTKKFEDLGKRTRYYQSMLDMDSLMRGEDYSKLKESFVIFICTDDPFEKDMPVYTFETVCLENNTVQIDDKMHKLIYNSKAYEQEKEKNPGLYSFLQFVNKNDASDDFTDEMANLVEKIKADNDFKTRYMAVNLHERDIRVEAERKGAHEKAIEAARNFLAMNILTPEQIAQGTGLPIEEVMELKQQSNN